MLWYGIAVELFKCYLLLLHLLSYNGFFTSLAGLLQACQVLMCLLQVPHNHAQ